MLAENTASPAGFVFLFSPFFSFLRYPSPPIPPPQILAAATQTAEPRTGLQSLGLHEFQTRARLHGGPGNGTSRHAAGLGKGTRFIEIQFPILKIHFLILTINS